jgi:hypothetical protein
MQNFMAKRFADMKMERPMDKMQVGISSPFEDEFAIANLSGQFFGLGGCMVVAWCLFRPGSADLLI